METNTFEQLFTSAILDLEPEADEEHYFSWLQPFW